MDSSKQNNIRFQRSNISVKTQETRTSGQTERKELVEREQIKESFKTAIFKTNLFHQSTDKNINTNC